MENVENAIFGPPDFKIFWVNLPPDPPTNLAPLSLIFKSPHLKIHSRCHPRQWSPGLPSLCQYTHGINTHSKKAFMLNKFGMKSSKYSKNTPLKGMRLFICKANIENAIYMYHYFIYILHCGFLLWVVQFFGFFQDPQL